MDIPELDKLNLNPFKYRHEDFTYNFSDLTHLEKLKGSNYKSEHFIDENTSFELQEIDEGLNKELRIVFRNTDSYFIERTCNTLFEALGSDDLADEEFTDMDYTILRDNPKGYNLRSWHKDLFSVHLTCIGWENTFLKIQTRLE